MAVERRKLNAIEKTGCSFENNSPFNVIICARISGGLSYEVLKESLVIMRKRHFYLSYFINEKKGGPEFVYDEKAGIPIRIIERASENRWISECAGEINGFFDLSKAPLASVVFIKKQNGFDIIVKMSHIISDGISVYYFVHDLLEVIDDLQNKRNSRFHDPLPDVYPDEKYFPPGPGKTAERGRIFHLPGEYAYIPAGKRSTGIYPYQLDEEQTKYVLDKCREEKTTVNSLLAAALIEGMKNHIIKKYQVGRDFTIKTSSGLNLRKYYGCGAGKEQLGCWAGFGYLFFNARKIGPLWETARLYDKMLREHIESGGPAEYLKKTVQAPLQPACANPIKKTMPYVLLTNLGRLEMPELTGRNLKLENISFMTPMHRHWANDLGFGICAATFVGRLNLIFQYMNPAWTPMEAKDHIGGLLGMLFEKRRDLFNKNNF